MAKYNFKKRDAFKIADQKRKEDAKTKKAKTHADRIQVVSSDMLRTSRLNGGSFPSLGLTLQEVYAQLAANANAPDNAPLRQTTMTQAYEDTHQVHAAAMPPFAAAMPPGAPLRQTTMTQAYEHPDPVAVLPPGWQACRGEDDKTVYFHKATRTFEASLDDLLFKKKKPRSAPPAAHITPDAPRKKTPPPRTTDSGPPDSPPRPDAPKSCSIVITSPTRKITITRVPGVVDLMTSGSSGGSSDEETDLEGPKTCDLPATPDFARAAFDFGRRRNWDSADDSASDNSSRDSADSDDKSKSLL